MLLKRRFLKEPAGIKAAPDHGESVISIPCTALNHCCGNFNGKMQGEYANLMPGKDLPAISVDA